MATTSATATRTEKTVRAASEETRSPSAILVRIKLL
jgi:hypothetical protein